MSNSWKKYKRSGSYRRGIHKNRAEFIQKSVQLVRHQKENIPENQQVHISKNASSTNKYVNIQPQIDNDILSSGIFIIL